IYRRRCAAQAVFAVGISARRRGCRGVASTVDSRDAGPPPSLRDARRRMPQHPPSRVVRSFGLVSRLLGRSLLGSGLLGGRLLVRGIRVVGLLRRRLLGRSLLGRLVVGCVVLLGSSLLRRLLV